MQHSIDDINLLPTPTQLRKTSQSLAMLDAILMPEWSNRYFSFDRHWDMLIPSSGHAATVQGEVIRIAGRITDEIDRNGGGNWDSTYRKMGKAYLQYISSENALSESEIAKLKSSLFGLESLYDETDNLMKYAVKWVSQNRMPIILETPNYNR